jgi:hypothetical protein
MSDFVLFRPDGWPLPKGMIPQGFAAHVSAVEHYDDPESPCVVTTPTGEPVTKTEIKRLVDERAARESRRPSLHERSR